MTLPQVDRRHQRAGTGGHVNHQAAGQVNGIADQEAHFYHNTVVEPAAYGETIAVAASTVNDKHCQ